MLITNGSRQCVLKLKDYSDKKINLSQRNRINLTELNSSSPDNARNRDPSHLNIDSSTGQLTETNEEHPLLGRLLNCKPCRQVTETHKRKTVCSFLPHENQKYNILFSRKMLNVIGKIAKQICIGNIRLLNFMLKLKKLIKSKKNLIIYRIGKNKKIDFFLFY